MEENRHIELSAIIPVYNGEKYLEEALNSLINQTFEAFEIICVDDGSTDKSLEILEKFKREDVRVKILRQNHQGAGAARNLGLLNARGTYIVFLDADDFFDKNMFEKIVAKGNKTQADVIVFGAKRYDNRTGQVTNAPWYLRKGLLPEKEVFSRKDAEGRVLEITMPHPWTKAFRREYILKENLRFQNLPNSNDAYFVLVALAAAERVTAIKEDFVFYRVFREGSLQNKKCNHPLCFLEAYEAVFDELNKREIYSEVERGFCNTVLSGCTYNLDTVNDEEARWEIIQALCSQRFSRMGLLDFPEDFYNVIANRDQIAGLPYALEVRRQLDVRLSYAPEELIKAGNYCGEKKVTVIIPIYNTEQYLAECIESILGQTLKELEVICIDDGSTDKSLEVLDNYAKTDDRVIIYQQKNCGLSMVRNRGLSHAAGEYIYFMDSDDILRQDALENLYNRSKEEKLDVLYFDAITMYENEDIKENHLEFDNYYVRKGEYPVNCTGSEMFVRMREAGEYRVNMGIQFFRRGFLEEEDLKFQPGIIHEDNDFTFRAMLLAERVGYISETYFNRRIRAQSIMTVKTRFNHIYGYFRSFLKMLSFIEENSYPEEMTELLYDTVYSVLSCAKKGYSELSDAEKYAAMGLKGSERIQFRLFIEQGAETVAKLHRTYAEKSEINRKLQITYGEKYDRGLEIKRLKKEIASIKKSRSYKLARIIGFPVRLVKRILNKGQK
ncbi:MAG: glycosyltransferase family 2 protein [Lachnospiraceae bacterium]